MTANQSRLLGVALLLSGVALVMHLARSGDAADGGGDRSVDQQALAQKQQREQEYARLRARFERGAFVLSSKRVSDAEEIQVVIIPEGNTEELDTRCIVYKNSELKTSSIACTGVLFRQPAPPS